MKAESQPGGDFDVVTGAFGYTGKHIARRLLATGRRIKTLTAHPQSANTPDGSLEIAPFNFDRPDDLAKSLEGATCVVNTYWVRFDYRGVTHERAVENSRTLIRAAARAGVHRFVQVSITNASEDSPLPYFRGKASVERAVRESGLSFAIVRPTVIFGFEDILLNNIAWMLRKFPVFAIPGTGEYRLQPIFVEDFAAIVVEAMGDRRNSTIDAIGPETFTFNELVKLLADATGSTAHMIHTSPQMALALAKMIGWFTRDVTLTRDEVLGLMANLLVSSDPPNGKTRLSVWLNENSDSIGLAYASELARRR